MATGWIKISRDIQTHWIYQDSEKLKWWLDLLLLANYEDKEFNIKFKVFQCKRGQLLYSLKSLSQRWNVSKSVVNNFLEMLRKQNMIETENETVTTRITICNYDTYQQKENAKETETKRNENANETQCDTTKESKEDEEIKEIKEKKDKSENTFSLPTPQGTHIYKPITDNQKPKTPKKKFSPPTIEDVILYFSENGYTNEIAKRAFNFYDCADWIDSKGNKVKNWKQKMQSVWFKDENKIKEVEQQPISKTLNLYLIPNNDLFGYDQNTLYKMCLDGKYPKR